MAHDIIAWLTFPMVMGVRADILGSFLITRRLKVPGWLTTVTMAIVVLAMLAT